jgi:hypothetical protein
VSRVTWLLLSLVSCKQDQGTAPAATESALASAVPSVTVDAGTAIGPRTYGGAYTATPGTLFVPDAAPWEHVKFRGDDAGALGEGTLTFSIDRDSGVVSGDLQGPLGPAMLSGLATGEALSFNVAPREQTEMAFSGTGMGTVDGGLASGEIQVSSWRANVLRTATFAAQAK